MSTFRVDVLRLTDVVPHPNADRLDLAVVGAFTSVVPKGEYKTGDLIAYIPEAAVLPDDLIEELGARNYLSGKTKNRVKAARLRGVLSEGIVMRARDEWNDGDDVAEVLGITKYEPETIFIRGGRQVDYSEFAEPAPSWWKSYDIEAYKRYPNLLYAGDTFRLEQRGGELNFQLPGETVWVTEKIHGTQAVFGIDYVNGDAFYVSSKGVSQKRYVLKRDDGNVYWQAAIQYEVAGKMVASPINGYRFAQVFAEVYGVQPSGKDIQDLTYNPSLGLRIAVFDIAVNGEFMDYQQMLKLCDDMGLPTVPVLYHGPFSQETLTLADGKETISRTSAHMREGIVMRPEHERIDPVSGERVVLKVVSGDYLTRKEGTEYS